MVDGMKTKPYFEQSWACDKGDSANESSSSFEMPLLHFVVSLHH